MTSFVTSADGTRIAYDRLGDGPPVVLISGITCDRTILGDLAARLATRFTAVTYDRRGRGESGDTPPYAVEREVEDLAAIIAELGGTAAVYGHSSGAGVALTAAAAGLPVKRLVLHEPPYSTADDESTAAARDLAARVRTAIEEGRPADALRHFLGEMGMPPEMVESIASDPKMLAIARTMPYDFTVMGDDEGGTVPDDVVRSIRVPTLVLAGGASPEFFRVVAEQIAALLPDGSLEVLDGQDHGAPADVVAPVVGGFLS